VSAVAARAISPLIGAGALLAFTVGAVFVGRSGAAPMQPAAEPIPVAALAFRAEDEADGGIALREAASAQVFARIRPGEDGFVRGTLRGLAQARQREGLGPEEPFRLLRYADGSLTLRDDATGRRVVLDAFGRSNAAAFARLIPQDAHPDGDRR
jgi:putative photosynthetic complex assembly protein